MLVLPSTADAFAAELAAFQSVVIQKKRDLPAPHPGWYPYNSFTGLEIGLDLIRPVYDEFVRGVDGKTVADIGCGDGDLSMVFANWGAPVDAIDNPPTNYNQMMGVERLATSLNLPVSRRRVDLDARFEFPGKYGLALFLGTLYHLQNPYFALDRLADHTGWCLLSTRIAQQTTLTGIRIAEEPLAYLASPVEVNSDITNFWIFSLGGLLRLLQRTRWTVRGIRHVGCTVGSNPSDPDADERVFLLLQSRVMYPGLQAYRGAGWYPTDGQPFCWTAKTFTLEVTLPFGTQLTGFLLPVYIPPDILRPNLTLEAAINNQPRGTVCFTKTGLDSFRGTLSPSDLHDPSLVITFTVHSHYEGDGRELGVCVPIANDTVALRVF